MSGKTLVDRVKHDYSEKDSKFIVTVKNYSKQYAHICSQRLIVLREVLKSKVKAKFGDDVPILQLFELTAGNKCVLIGSLFKEMDLKPNILKELGDEYGFTAQPVLERYTSASDRVILEDELQQIQLTGKIDKDCLITGSVVACYGYEEDENRGQFIVEELIFPDVDLPPLLPTAAEDK